ncbi:type I-E CRISPR-associated endoribonuclease Cas2e [Streptomyces sp. NBC_00525]|uniref:type I-E CRISPR-associated endoribonuclease Cas2e n=1 Tax=Streptomyces sp. NBC_00525 TaxID=2903660 RepID=UPI002E8015D2|nr:type I-E CRISPR-associated endoribonuclease Cas2e [Streptomyces sp. NBC_00525]WUC96526.1 type I-E CRISPR-associated endoribonuclease Cas2e [Streptomyces sp. NBC_00525]
MSAGTTVVVLVAAPAGLRGHLTRWFTEVAAGVYVGNPNPRIRDRLWNVVADRIHDGQAVMIEPATNEQGWTARTAGRDRWSPVDFDGLTLIARPRQGGRPWRPTAETK